MLIIGVGSGLVICYIVHAWRAKAKAKRDVGIEAARRELRATETTFVTSEVRDKSHELRGQSQKFRHALHRLGNHPNPIEAFVNALHSINGRDSKEDNADHDR